MLEPNGPLPPEIYWRRRILAIVVAVVVLVLIIWAAVALLGGGGEEPETEPAAAESSTSVAATTSAADSTADAAGAETTGGGTGSSGGADSSGETGSSGESDSSGGATTSGDAASTTPSSATAVVAEGQCPDQSLAVRVTSAEANYQAGAEPEFTIVITNIGTSTCERDLGAGLQEVLVYSLDGNRRLWSNTDCFPESTSDVRSLGPGDQAAFSVKWSGTTSEPGCETPREPVGPGAYTVVGQLGGLRSTPEPFNIAPQA